MRMRMRMRMKLGMRMRIRMRMHEERMTIRDKDEDILLKSQIIALKNLKRNFDLTIYFSIHNIYM